MSVGAVGVVATGRDPARISRVLAELEIYWRRHPDLRLCQIVGNFLNEQFASSTDYEIYPPELDMTSRAYCVEDVAVLAYLVDANDTQDAINAPEDK